MQVFKPAQRAATRQVFPSQGVGEMPLDHRLSGRMERRLPIIVVVRLKPAVSAGADGEEKTFTDILQIPLATWRRGAGYSAERRFGLGEGDLLSEVARRPL